MCIMSKCLEFEFNEIDTNIVEAKVEADSLAKTHKQNFKSWNPRKLVGIMGRDWLKKGMRKKASLKSMKVINYI
jgi:hypothetical protein